MLIRMPSSCFFVERLEAGHLAVMLRLAIGITSNLLSEVSGGHRLLIKTWAKRLTCWHCGGRKREGRPVLRRPSARTSEKRLVIHVAHASRRHRRRGFWLRLLGHHGLCRDEEARNGRGILQCGAYDLGRINHPLLD